MVLEVPLAVIAVTTAVKDLVEIGQKIHGSFAKVSRNIALWALPLINYS